MTRNVYAIALCVVVGSLSLQSAARAQSPSTPLNPTQVVFTASADHTATMPDGTVPKLTNYQLSVFVGSTLTTTAPIFTTNIGKPTPDALNTITATIPGLATLGDGTYVATVSAVGPAGSNASPVSNSFWHAGPPAAPGKPAFK